MPMHESEQPQLCHSRQRTFKAWDYSVKLSGHVSSAAMLVANVRPLIGEHIAVGRDYAHCVSLALRIKVLGQQKRATPHMALPCQAQM
ncbi:hypothetical protein ALUC_81345S [Aspergillus luchuensis]|nr:hypothetical protein ALUC_81345S [Aspergillus luchuensis]